MTETKNYERGHTFTVTEMEQRMKANNVQRTHRTVLFLTQSGAIAALYVVFTWVSALFGLSSGVIQVRISEALCILPAFTPAAIPALTVGCFLANLLTGGLPLDAVFGSLATLLGALGAWCIGKYCRRLPAPVYKIFITLPNVAANTLIVPWVLRYVYGAQGAIPYFMLTVGAGEFLATTVLGFALFVLLQRILSKKNFLSL